MGIKHPNDPRWVLDFWDAFAQGLRGIPQMLSTFADLKWAISKIFSKIPTAGIPTKYQLSITKP